MTQRPREIIWKQHVAGEALPQYHRRTIRILADPPPPRDWGGIVQTIALTVMAGGILLLLALVTGSLGGPQ